MKVIFISGPYRGKNAWEVECNVRASEGVAWELARRGYAPLCPHTNTRFFDGTLTDEFWLNATLELMMRCDAVVMVDGWEKSEGANKERDSALFVGIPVFYSVQEMECSK